MNERGRTVLELLVVLVLLLMTATVLIPGLRAVNAGALETARLVEQLTPLLISINARYKTHAGVRITGLPYGDPWE